MILKFSIKQNEKLNINIRLYAFLVLGPYNYEKNPKKRPKVEENWKNSLIPFYLNRYENLISKNGGYLHGHKVILLNNT